MKKLVVLFLAFITFSCSQAQKKSFSAEALSETLMTTDGNQIAFRDILEKHKGKITVIEIWASWCGDCVKAMPKMTQLQNDNPNVDYVFISVDRTIENWKIGIEKHEIKGDHYMANDQMKGFFGKAIDLDWIPRYIVIDKTGKVVIYRAIETDFIKIDSTLKELNK